MADLRMRISWKIPSLMRRENYLIPGLVDIHFHGCAGHDFSDGTPEALQAIGAYELKNGITSICPASMTLAEETLANVCENAYAYYTKPETDKPEGSRLCGIHLEGPFISMEKKGAQNPAYVKSPDIAMFNRLQDAAHGLVKLITIAPETEGAEEFIKELLRRFIFRLDIHAAIMIPRIKRLRLVRIM